jgi:hypothetical protein
MPADAENAVISLQNAVFRERCVLNTDLNGELLAHNEGPGHDGLVSIEDLAGPPPQDAVLLQVFSTGWHWDYADNWIGGGDFVIETPLTLHDGEFTLSSVVMASRGHFTALVRSHDTGNWYDIDVPAGGVGTTVNPLKDGLPAWATIISAVNMNERKPSMFVYLRF